MTGQKLNLSLKNQMYFNILQSIIHGEYQPESILTEKILVEKYQVSKSPIREALIELCNEGVLRSIPRYGYEVIKITDNDVREVQSFRLIVECGSMDKYWDLLNLDIIKKNIDLSDNEKQHDALEHWENNIKFHLELVSCYGNRFLYKSLSDALRYLSRAYAQFYWDKWRRTTFISKSERHKKIIEYIKVNDKEQAIKTLEADINEFAKGDEFYKPIFG